MKKSIKSYVLVVSVAVLTVLSNVLFKWLENFMQQYMVWSVVIFIVIIIAHFAIKWRQNVDVDLDVDPIRDETAQKQLARKGLIIFLSLYRQLPGKAQPLTPQQINLAAKNCDYKTLGLADTTGTTFGHQINAIKAHISKLQHCWIICTRTAGEGKHQSLDYVPVFVEFIQKEVAPNLQMHYGKKYSVLLDDDAIVCRNAYNLVKSIYKKARKLKIKQDEIITDITGGFRAITVGAILGCLDKAEDIQYIGADYDEGGNPTGEMFPMIVQYKPEIVD